MTQRHLITLLALILLVLGYLALDWYRRAHRPSPQPTPIHPRVSQSKFTISGMTYTNSYKGKPLIKMKVNSVEFGKKKMRFFRVGGMRQLELRGAEIDYYEPRAETTGDVDRIEDPRDISSGILSAAQSFTGSKGRVAGFQARKVKLRYHHADGNQTDIDGDLMEFNLRDKSLRIRGNATVRHAGRSLSSDEIFFQPQDKTFFTEGNYALTVNGESQRGNQVRTDLFLKPLPGSTTKKDRAAASTDSNRVAGRARYFENEPDSNR